MTIELRGREGDEDMVRIKSQEGFEIRDERKSGKGNETKPRVSGKENESGKEMQIVLITSSRVRR